MKINIYAVNCNDAQPNTDGDDISASYVKYKDHQEVVSALEARCAALAADNEKAMEAMRQADEVVKRAHSKFAALTDENMALRSALENGMTAPETPATDAFLAEVRASALEYYANLFKDTVNMDVKHNQEFHKGTLYIADQLRKGASL